MKNRSEGYVDAVVDSARNICQQHWKQAHCSGVILANWQGCHVAFSNICNPSISNYAPLWVEKILQTLTFGDPFKTH